jgi:hypothetical protein
MGKLVQRVTYDDIGIWQLAAFISASTKKYIYQFLYSKPPLCLLIFEKKASSLLNLIQF